MPQQQSRDDTVISFDRRQSPVAAELQRGVCRALRANGRRADVVALSGGGDITIVEIKSCLLDYQTDGKWQDYLEFCDRLYFAVNADFPCEVIPGSAGLILADRYGAELVRQPVEERLSAARRTEPVATEVKPGEDEPSSPAPFTSPEPTKR